MTTNRLHIDPATGATVYTPPCPITVAVAFVRPESRSAAVGYGIDLATGEGIAFGLEYNPAARIAVALDAGEQVTVELEPWQIVDRQKAVAS